MNGCPVYMMDSALTWWILLSCLIKPVHLELHLSKQGKTHELVHFILVDCALIC